jgi:hypothetical protein
MEDGHPRNVFEKIHGFFVDYSREKNHQIDLANFRQYEVPVGPTVSEKDICS